MNTQCKLNRDCPPTVVFAAIITLSLLLTSLHASGPSDLRLPARPLNSYSPLAMGATLFPGSTHRAKASSANDLPDLFAPSNHRLKYTKYPWKTHIKTTVFWVGETPTKNNPTPNTASSWDMKWTQNFGGFDDPKARNGYLPKKFVPSENPFYIALPYNDIYTKGTKPTASKFVPWYKETFYRNGRTVLKGRWLAIRHAGKVCYAQWEDCGPFETDDYHYVFGDKPQPNTKGNGGAGLDVSPAVRDYLEFSSSGMCDWRFVDLHEVPDGPWKNWGRNNPFANKSFSKGSSLSSNLSKLQELRRQLQSSLLDR